ncbi:hypothetical protein KIW84_076702 [Lathyrus oleraceus]|uniref:Uncharacterized protein n=1 Tax=Pisum sativum TaxID=3888 RepID=A0A9D4VYY1_PEA|nr:hypothetical protein KIW84_076702 [Pisum sativum]
MANLETSLQDVQHEVQTSQATSKLMVFTVITDSLMAIGDPISKCDQIDSILQELPKDYSPFIMMVHGKTDPMDIYDVEGLLYVQEA